MSTSDIGLSPDPMNPLNDLSTMNKTMRHGLQAAGGRLRPEGDAGLGGRRRRVRQADRRRQQDVRDYAQAIVDLVDDAALRARMGSLGRARVEEELAWPHQERAYLGVYQQAAPLTSKGN